MNRCSAPRAACRNERLIVGVKHTDSMQKRNMRENMAVNLDGQWKLSYALEAGRAKEREVVTIPATVPGNVELDLMRAGTLPDLFQGCNILKARPFDFYEWTYETSFTTPAGFTGRRVELVFHGVDCVATYLLNGVELGRSENMFVEQRFDVTDSLRANRENQLVVRIGSAVNHARARAFEPSVNAFAMESVALRKAAHSFGWDIMPRLPSAGIWRSVELVAHEATELTDVHVFTAAASQSEATLGVRYAFATDAPTLEGFEIQIQGRCGESTFERRVAARFTAGEVAIPVPGAKLWWPRGYGEASLYDLTVRLIREGAVIDSRLMKIGIRTVELVRSEITTRDRPGEFLFKPGPVEW